MEQPNVLSKVFNILFPFSDFLYILQLEEYSSRRLLKWLPRFFFRRNFQLRNKLVYTTRVKKTLAVILIIWFGDILLAFWLFDTTVAVILTLVIVLLTPVYVLIGNILISPYFENIKNRIRREAAEKVSNIPNLRIVTVAGSYGKTTVKNFVQQLVQYNYKTQMIPGNINTPAGIANWVNSNLESSTELLIAEVDAYEIGEIAKSCEVVPADIAVLTNIGDQHLERFGSKEELKKALSEVLTHSKPNASLVLTSNTLTELNARSLENRKVYELKLEPIKADMSESNKINLQLAIKVAELLNIPDNFVEDTIPKLEEPDRRQKLGEMFGYEAIDDSYNISFTTAQSGIEAARMAANKAGKKLLVITAGIPELSAENKDNNKKLGEVLSQKADHIVVLGSMFADEILMGVNDSSKATRVKDLKIFLEETKQNFPKDEWFLLMQPELGDLYY